MAEVAIKYKGSTIAEMNEAGTKTLSTGGKYCEGDISVQYTRPAADEPEVVQANYKQFSYTSAAAVASQYVTVVSGDPDVAAHYADETALVTVQKIKDTLENGIVFLMAGNRSSMNKYGLYGNYNASTSVFNSTGISTPINSAENANTTTPHIIVNANGDIKVYCIRTYNNFGGASYDIRFSW